MENVWTIDGKFLENALMPVMRGMLGMLSPKSGQFCRKRAT